MRPAGAPAWLDAPPDPDALAEALARIGEPSGEELAGLLDALETARAQLEQAAREAFARAPVSRATAAFHSALPDLRPFVLYRLPGLLREAGFYTADELRALAPSASPAWVAREATRQLAGLAAVRQAIRRLDAGDLRPADFPAAIHEAARSVATGIPPAHQEDKR